MNKVVFIIDIILLILLGIFTVKAVVDINKSEGKLLEEVRPKLLKDVKITIVFNILLFVSLVITVLIRSK